MIDAYINLLTHLEYTELTGHRAARLARPEEKRIAKDLEDRLNSYGSKLTIFESYLICSFIKSLLFDENQKEIRTEIEELALLDIIKESLITNEELIEYVRYCDRFRD